MGEIYIRFKAYVGCLLTHQIFWEDREEMHERLKYCNFCKQYFQYPSKVDDEPKYRVKDDK